jgi:hypothetical protein
MESERTWTMNTVFMLMAQYDGKVIIPLEDVCNDYFHLTPAKFVEKLRAGEIKLPLVRMERSQKAAKGIALSDLAAYLDHQIDAARKDLEAMTGSEGLRS